MADSPGTLPEGPAVDDAVQRSDIGSPAVALAKAGGQFQWRADTVFAMLADSTRRRLLARLTDGIARPASKLASSRLDATLKHLTALRDSGLLIAQPDPQDARRKLYSLSPNITVRPREDGQEM